MPSGLAVTGARAKVGSRESLKARHSAGVVRNCSACAGEQKLCGVSGGAAGGVGGVGGGGGGLLGRMHPVSSRFTHTRPSVMIVPAQHSWLIVPPDPSRPAQPTPPQVPQVFGQQTCCAPESWSWSLIPAGHVKGTVVKGGYGGECGGAGGDGGSAG